MLSDKSRVEIQKTRSVMSKRKGKSLKMNRIIRGSEGYEGEILAKTRRARCCILILYGS